MKLFDLSTQLCHVVHTQYRISSYTPNDQRVSTCYRSKNRWPVYTWSSNMAASRLRIFRNIKLRITEHNPICTQWQYQYQIHISRPDPDVRTHFSRLKPFDKHISPFVTRWRGRVDCVFMWRLRKVLSEIAFWINGTRSRSAGCRAVATWYIPSVTTIFHRVSVRFYSRSQLTAGSHAASSPVAPPRFGLAGRARKDGKGRESGASHQPSLALRTRAQLSCVALQEPEKKRLWRRQGSHVRRKDKRQHKHKKVRVDRHDASFITYYH